MCREERGTLPNHRKSAGKNAFSHRTNSMVCLIGECWTTMHTPTEAILYAGFDRMDSADKASVLEAADFGGSRTGRTVKVMPTKC